MIRIFTDGSNVHNGKPYSYGGYGYVIEVDGEIVIKSGYSMHVDENKPVTNNRAELCAIIESLLVVGESYSDDVVELYSDSQWCVKCANREWAMKKNVDLWLMFNKAMKSCRKSNLDVSINWVKGHVGNELNEMADELAGSFCKAAKP